MDEPASPSASRSGWLERLTHLLLREPENRTDLVDILHVAYEKNLLDADALGMIEGVLSVNDMQVRDVMVPRSQMEIIDIAQPPAEFIPTVIETAHSRFPVIEGERDNVIGILLAKDLLRYCAGNGELSIRELLRPAVFIPESKHLDVLLKDFRNNRNHMALVVDEYGSIAGLVTIEDVVEQIVGDIEDEFDCNEEENHIIQDRRGHWRVKGITELSLLNATLGSQFSNGESATVAGLVNSLFDHLPARGDSIQHAGFRFQVLRADSRRIHSLLVERLPSDANEAPLS